MLRNIRLALIEDSARIADIHVRSWRWAYRHIIPDDALTDISVDSRTLSWKAQLAGDSVRVLVAESDHHLRLAHRFDTRFLELEFGSGKRRRKAFETDLAEATLLLCYLANV